MRTLLLVVLAVSSFSTLARTDVKCWINHNGGMIEKYSDVKSVTISDTGTTVVTNDGGKIKFSPAIQCKLVEYN